MMLAEEEREEEEEEEEEEDKTIRPKICGQDVDVTKLVADVEFIALIDKLVQ